jgi:DNA-binding beta-propeller fold protein YncE
VTPVAVATGKAGKPITVGAGPDAIVITPGGLFALVADYYSGTVIPVRLSANAAGAAITVGSKPAAIAVTP